MPWSKIKPELEEPVFQGGEAGGIPVGTRRLTYPQAIREGLEQALELDTRVFVMGQGVDDPGGMFGTTLNLHKRFGPERVFDIPLAETALMGVAVGAALGGMRPVYFNNRPDFLYLGMDQLVNHASKWFYMFGGATPVPLVVWACIGRGWGSAAQHSQAMQGLFAHVPGLKVVMPSRCFDAKGLMLAAIADPNPVLIMDHRSNFKFQGLVPTGPYRVPLGKAAIRRSGDDLTLIGLSHMTMECFLAAEELAKEGVQAEVIDLRTLRPLDEELILASVRKTGRVIIADSAWKTGGFPAEISAMIAEKAFPALRAPILRVACPDVPTPAGYTLEQGFYVGKEDILRAARRLLAMPQKETR